MELLLASLGVVFGTYRVAHMVAIEEGPFEIFSRFRTLFGGDTQATWVGRGVNCVLCISFWVSLAFVILAYLGLKGYWWADLLILWQGTAGIVIVIHEVLSR